MSRSPTMVEALNRLVKSHLRDLHVALPARVERYDLTKQEADVQPLIQDHYTDEEGQKVVFTIPVIPSVPVVFPGAGGFRVTFPVLAGDTVLLVFSEASLDKWLQQGGLVDPGMTHRHNLSDAIAIPGLRDFAHALTEAPTDRATFGKDGGLQIHITEEKIGLGGGPGEAGMEPVALGQTLQTFLNQLVTALSALVLPVSGPSAGPPAPGTIPSAPTVTATKAEVK
jgi:hypothetical protein